MPRLFVWHTHGWSTYMAWLIPKCDMAHSYVWHDSFICVTWLIHMCDMTHSYVRHDSFICVTWLIHMCDTTHSYGGYDAFICAILLIIESRDYSCREYLRMVCRLPEYRFWCRILFAEILTPFNCDMIHSCLWHDSYVRVTLLIRMCGMTDSCACHDSFICVAACSV